MLRPDQSPDEQESAASQSLSETTSEAQAQSTMENVEKAPLVESTRLQEVDPPATYTPEEVEAIRQGKMYPPPPSFYQGEAFSQPLLPLPSAPSVAAGPSVRPAQPPATPVYSNGHPSGQPAGNWPPAHPLHRGQTSHLPPGARPYPSPPTAPVKKSSTWIWITILVILLALLATCGLCAWTANTFVGPVLRQSINVVANGVPLTNHYYDALENKDYSQAYSYLDLSDTNQQQFQQQAQAQDDKYGAIYQYTVGQPAITYSSTSSTTGTTIKSFTVIVKVVRQKKSYSTLLTVEQVGQQWRITHYDSI